MPLRDKLKKVFHKEEDDSAPSSPASRHSTSSPVQSNRYSQSVGGTTPRTGRETSSTFESAATNPSQYNAPASGTGNPITSSKPGRTSIDPQGSSSTNLRRSEDVMSHARVPGNVRPARYSEDVADWNIGQSTRPKDEEVVPAPLKVKRTSRDYSGPSTINVVQRDEAPINFSKPSGSSGMAGGRSRKESISRKVVPSTPATNFNTNTHSLEHKTSSGDLRDQAILDKSMPGPHDANHSANTTRDVAASGLAKKFVVEDAPVAPSLEGLVDLRNTVDTTVDEKWAPAVVRETVNREVHHIREEAVTREIHYHDIYHRVLPIIDVEVLPTRHFLPDGSGGLIEISEDEIPGRAGPYRQNWAIVETVSTGNVTREPRRFTARKFHGDEGDYKEYVSPTGVHTTETTWVHPPVIEEYSELLGQTEPFHFGSSDPRDDGLRIRAPSGPITGTSRLHAERMSALAPPTNDMSNLSLNAAAGRPEANSFASSKGESRILPQYTTRAGQSTRTEDPRLARA